MNKSRVFGIILGIFLVASLCFVFVQPVHAATINPNGNIASGQTVDDDVILGGDTVQMDGTVNGLLFAAGKTVTITGTVNGDVIAAAQMVIISDTAVITGNLFTGAQVVTLNGKVEGSVLAGASNLDLGSQSSVGRNLYFGGYSLGASTGSSVGTDIRMGGYQALLSGSVGHDVVANAEAVEINGSVGRNVEVWMQNSDTKSSSAYVPGTTVASVAPGLKIGANGKVGGQLIYTSPVQYNLPASAVSGGVVYNQYVPEKKPTTFGPELVSQETGSGFKVWHAISSFITLLLCGALALWLFGSCFEKTVLVAEKRTLASAGVGLLVLFLAIPAFVLAALVLLMVGILISFLTLGGLSFATFGLGFGALGLAATALIVLITIVSKLIVADLIGKLIFQAAKTNLSGFWAKALPLLVGVVIVVVMSALPFVGWLFSLIAIIIGVGAVWFWLFPGKPALPQQPPLPNVGENN